MRLSKIRARITFELRRAWQLVWGFGLATTAGVLLWRGWFPDLRHPGAEWRHGLAAAMLAAALVVKLAGRIGTSQRRRTRFREMVSDLEMGLLLLGATYVFLSVVGGVTSPLYPLVYALVSFLVTFHPLSVGAPLAVAALGFEAVLAFGPGAAPGAAAAFPGHAGFIAVFAVLNVAFLHAEVARQRRENRKCIQDEVESMREEARDFRLISSALSGENRGRTRAEEEEKLSQGSIESIREQLLHTVDLLRRSMKLQTCALLWLDGSGDRLKFKELSSDSPHVSELPLSARAGVFAAIIKDRRPCVLEAPRASLLTYYQGPADVACFVGVPVSEGLSIRGVLVGDRREGSSFSQADVEIFEAAAEQVMRIVQSERVFQAVEKSKHEHERFYRASAALNRALSMDEIYDAAIEGAAGACEFDFAAIAIFEKGESRHVISRVTGQGSSEWVGRAFADGSSIASMVVKNKLAMPAAGDWRDRGGSYVFDSRERLKGFDSLYVLPLLVKDEVIGTFTVAAQRPNAFPADRREMLGVIANQVAISLQNGRMVQALEEQATTDGLTGLVNHRTFQERFSTMLGRADRHQMRVAFILTDIDHFKKINDTHGHPVGDQVLKRVSRILKASARKIDIVARYGGEEFALVLDGTDRAGARQLAERIRQEVGALTHDSAKGAFRATLSLGVAVYPDDGRTKQELISNADQCLYAAKHAGRNRTVCHGDMAKEKTQPQPQKARAAG